MERIRILREEANLKQEDIAKILGIKRATYSSYEIGRDTIPIKHLNTLCNYFDISIDYALELTDLKKYPNMRKEIDRQLGGMRIKNLRKTNKITQVSLSKHLNIARSSLANYEKGITQMPTLLLYDIAKNYNSSIDYLIGKID